MDKNSSKEETEEAEADECQMCGGVMSKVSYGDESYMKCSDCKWVDCE